MADKKEIIENLTKSYWMEIETVMNYLSNSVNLDGVRAEEIKKSLSADITEELGHAQALAKRLKELGSTVPGSENFKSITEKTSDAGGYNRCCFCNRWCYCRRGRRD